MYTVLLVLFVFTSLLLMLVVLVQSSKGSGLGGAFGGGQVLFGGRGAAPFLVKVTTYLAAAYFVLALMLGVVSARQRSTRSAIERELAGVAGELTNPGVPVSSALELLSDSAATDSGR